MRLFLLKKLKLSQSTAYLEINDKTMQNANSVVINVIEN